MTPAARPGPPGGRRPARPPRHDHATGVAAARLAALADVEGPILVVCDFDGTLAAIHPDPAGATLDPGVRRGLRHLARIARDRPERLALAILSGRTALDVAGRVRIGGVTYLGDHGLQAGTLPPRVPAERLAVRHDARHADHAAASRRLGDDVGRLLSGADWLHVEPKGPSVAFHYRTADDPAAARERILAALGAAREALPEGLRARRFEQVDSWRILEVRPEGAGAKGAAVDELVARHRPAAVAVIGDDRPDVEAFAAAAAARRGGRLVASLAIGVRRGADTPPEVERAADVLLPGPAAVGDALRALAHRLETEARGG